MVVLFMGNLVRVGSPARQGRDHAESATQRAPHHWQNLHIRQWSHAEYALSASRLPDVRPDAAAARIRLRQERWEVGSTSCREV